MRKMNQKGFTIIELLVVIVIIGILVALTLPNLFSAQARGRDTDRKNELKNIQQKLETFYNDNGGYPAGEDISVLAPEPDAETSPGVGLTTDESQDPKNVNYGYDSDGSTYTLTADLENDTDKDAIDASGTYQIQSVNQ